jgi:hypothetical protein
MGSSAGMAPDYLYIINALTTKLIRNLWDRENLEQFTRKFVRRPVIGLRPIVGIGLDEAEGSTKVRFLSTVDPDNLKMEEFLSEEGFGFLEFGITNTGPISAASKVVKAERKAQGGDEIQRKDGTAGTFGCMVDHSSGSAILTCQHVLSSLGDQKIGGEVMWSGRRVGVVQAIQPIVMGATGANEIDAALCKPDNLDIVTNGVRNLGSIAGSVSDPAFGLRVRKEGAASGVTTGAIRLKNVSAAILFPEGIEAIFINQLGIIGSTKDRFAIQGDSGALLLDERNSAVGLLCAVSSGIDLTYASPIGTVITKLAIRLL